MYLKKFITTMIMCASVVVSASEYSFAKRNQSQQLEVQMRNVMAQAEKGDPSAQFTLSRLYYKTGIYAAKNYIEAARWATKSAKNNNREAQMFLGALYLKGEGVKKDQIVAYVLFRLAAEQGEPFSVKNLKSIRDLLTDKEKVTADVLYAKHTFLVDLK